jgi:hypothetical protein
MTQLLLSSPEKLRMACGVELVAPPAYGMWQIRSRDQPLEATHELLAACCVAALVRICSTKPG